MDSVPRKPRKQMAMLLVKVKMNLDCVSPCNADLASACVESLGRSLAGQPGLGTDDSCSGNVSRAVHVNTSPCVSAPLGHRAWQ